MMKRAVVGRPRDAIAKIEMLADAGVTQVSIGGPLGPDPAAAIRLMGDKVIPYFR
jgi:5,10-methylenetetrahydromethanopterin reductase